MKADQVYVVVVEPEYPGNLGLIARVMKNFNFENLRLVNPKAEIGPEAFKMAVKGGEILEKAETYASLDEALKDLDVVVGTTAVWARSRLNLQRVTVYPWEFAGKTRLLEGKMGILFGRESIGLKNEELARCDLVVTIPANPAYPVLNVSMAAAIVLYELYKALNELPAGQSPITPAPLELKERLIECFDKLVSNGRVQRHKGRLASQAFKNLVGRAFISEKEARAMLNALYKLLRISKS